MDTFCTVRVTASSSEIVLGRNPGLMMLKPFEFVRKFCFKSLEPINLQIDSTSVFDNLLR